MKTAEFLTTQELMRLLKIKHRQTIYHLIEEGLPVLVAGRNYRFRKNEVIAYLKKTSQDKISQRNGRGVESYNGTKDFSD